MAVYYIETYKLLFSVAECTVVFVFISIVVKMYSFFHKTIQSH